LHSEAKSITPIVLRTWFPISYCAKNVLYAAFSKKVKSGDFVTGYEPQRLGEKTFPGLPVNIDEDLIRMTAAQTANALK
jgi:hypothetical protein